MSDSIPASSSPPPPPAAAPVSDDARQRRRRRRLTVVIAIVVLALIAAAWADNWRRSNALQLELAKRLADADQTMRDSKSLAQQAQEAAREAQAKTALLEARL